MYKSESYAYAGNSVGAGRSGLQNGSSGGSSGIVGKKKKLKIKTAKEICKTIKNRPNVAAKRIVAEIVDVLESSIGGFVCYYEHYLSHIGAGDNEIYSDSSYATYSSELVALLLTDLGFKIEPVTKTLIATRNVVADIQVSPAKTFCGIVYKDATYKQVTQSLTKDHIVKGIKISACCGEEHSKPKNKKITKQENV